MDAIRKIFQIPFFEAILAYPEKRQHSLVAKLVPGNHLYPQNSIRRRVIDGITLDLNLHDYVEHFIYYNITDALDHTLYDQAKPGMVVYDIGTNIGYVALKLAKKVGNNGKIYGFEPDSTNFKKALHNTTVLNPWATNISIANSGLGDKKGQHKLYVIEEGNNGMHQIREDMADKPFTTINIEVLDDFIGEKGIPAPGLIKIDTEGYEMNILKGAVKTVSTYKPVLFLEIDDNNLRAQNSSAKELVAFVNDLGYTIKAAGSDKVIQPSGDFANCHFDGICIPV